MFATWHKAIELLDSGLDISPLITHHFAPSEFEKAIDVMQDASSGKVILEWDTG